MSMFRHNLCKLTSDGIEPPLSDLESEVLPLHHEALQVVRWPSGLRRYVQVVVSSGAWVRTPPSPYTLFFLRLGKKASVAGLEPATA